MKNQSYPSRKVQVKKSTNKLAVRQAAGTQKWQQQKSVLLCASLIITAVIVAVILEIGALAIRNQPKFCYVRSGRLICKSEGGLFAPNIMYDLPEPGGNELTSLIPSPDQKHYIAISAGSQTGLDTNPPKVWLLDKRLRVVSELDQQLIDSNPFLFGRIFAVWSPDSSKVLFKVAAGSDTIIQYDLHADKLTIASSFDAFSKGPCGGYFVGYYGYDSSGRIFGTCGDQLTGAETIGSSAQDSKSFSIKGTYAGVFAPTKEGPIIYNVGNTFYSSDPDGSNKRKLATMPAFSFYRYDFTNDMLYMVHKNQDPQGDTLGVTSVAYMSGIDLLQGMQPHVAELNSTVHAEGTAYLTPVGKNKIVLSGLNGSVMYDLATGKNSPLSPAPSAVVQGDASPNLDGITGTLTNFSGLHWNLLHNSFTIKDQIRGLNSAPKDFRTFIKAQFAGMNQACIQKPDRYGSQLDMKILGVQNNKAAVAFGCQVTGYWGKAGYVDLYQKQNGIWQALATNPPVTSFTDKPTGNYYFFPTCAQAKTLDFTASVLPTCLKDEFGGGDYIPNPLQ